MKKLFFSVCAVSLLLFSACSKDDDKDVSEMSSEEISSMIIGTWQSIRDEWIDQIEGEEGSGVDNYDETKQTVTFNSDKTYTETTYEIASGETDENTGKWRIENNTLIIFGEAWVIEKLTKDELILCYELDADDEYWFERWYLKR